MNPFDILGTIELTATAAILVACLSAGIGGTVRVSILVATAYAAWFGLIVLIAANGGFDAVHGLGFMAVGAAVLVPVAGLSLAAATSAAFRDSIARFPLTLLILVNAVRVLGASFLLLRLAGRLPAPFAPVAGWGDIFIAVASLPIALVASIRGLAAVPLIHLWNTLGLLDLIIAVGLGVTSAVGSPIRVFFDAPGTQIMGTLPWILIPGFLVPNLMLTHLAIFWKTRQRAQVLPVR